MTTKVGLLPDRVRNLLHQDCFGQFLAYPQPGVAHLANKTGIPGDEFDLLFLAKTHLPQSIANFRADRKMFDRHSCARFDFG